MFSAALKKVAGCIAHRHNLHRTDHIKKVYNASLLINNGRLDFSRLKIDFIKNGYPNIVKWRERILLKTGFQAADSVCK